MRGAQLPIHHFTRIDSTNEEARRLFKKGHGEACWIIADEQTAGRGRRGRRWESETGNFAATLYMPGPISVASAGHMSFVTGLAIHDCLADLTSAELHVKWPNDLLLDGCKLSGMLLEAFKITDGNVFGLAIGIGINLAHHPENMPYPATHLALHRSSRIIKNHDSSERMGENHDPLAPLNILKALSVCFATRLHDYHQNGFAPCRAAWLERAFGVGTVIQVNLEAEQMLGVFEGLDDAGQLLLRQDDGTTHKITAGDIFFKSVGHGQSS